MWCRYLVSTIGVFDGLARSTLYNWFTLDGKEKERYLPHVARHGQIILGTPNEGALCSRPDVLQEICNLILQMRDAGQSLSIGVIQSIIKGVITA